MRTRMLFWLEVATAVMASALAILTMVSPDWVEALTDWSPDHGNGSTEVVIVLILFAIGLAFTLAARRAHRRLLAAT